MNSSTAQGTNWFDKGAEAYARFRPHYPQSLAAYLASLAPNTTLALDVGCGNGQLTRDLAKHFSAVTGVDPSEDQIAHCTAQANVRYQCAPAEDLPLPSHSVSLITAAQAAHWFDLPRFYAEVRRVAIPGAILALISYGVPLLEPILNDRFQRFYWNEIGPYWPAQRTLVDSGYATLDFPFAHIKGDAISFCLEWNLEEFLGYICTWSAVRQASQAGQDEVLKHFAEELARLWGEPTTKRPVTWPINMRIGRV
jgi:SAM-dependent methyltransferase